LAAILIGCGGGGGGGGGTTTPPTTGGVPGATQPGDSIAMVNLPAPSNATGRVNVAYLPLQGRALETFTVLIRNIELGFGADTFVEPIATPISFVLNGNAVQQRSASVPIPNNVSRAFDTFYLNIDTLIDDPSPGQAGGESSFGDADNPFIQELGFPANVRVLPSRETTVPIFLNDAMISIVTDPDSSITTASFLNDVFTGRNGTPIQGFISDFLAFDTSAMAGKRALMSNGQRANRAYFSGDRFALGDNTSSGYFEMLTTDLTHPDPGEYQDPQTITNSQSPGIYRTLTADPTDPFHTAQITNLVGIFRFFDDPTSASRSMVSNTGSFEVILMPKTADDDTLQIILVSLNGNKATNLYWGDAHLSSGSFVAFPMADISNGSSLGAIQGDLSGFLDANASAVSIASPSDGSRVRYGRYAITTTVPNGFSRTGRFIVFRK
jgi:hypothetical protein